ncbi:glycoside hydrolase superfamily [Terfezia claveryi]|nr:glycoside hydrolase superfamily [Terfezia claveryi]
MERMSPPGTGLGGPFDSAYLGDLKTTVNYITSKGGFAVIDPHNYMRYNGALITDDNAFESWWKKLATEFKDNDKVIFDINNEPNGITAEEAFTMMQAGVNGIRASGATQLILVSGTSFTGAWSWVSSGNSASMAGIKDPINNWAVQMHQYLDGDGSGTSPTCVSSTVGKERMQAATEWCKSNNVKCFLGEIGAGSNQDCIDAVNGALCTMQQAEGVWIGALWWAGGPWWHDYFQSMEPPNGAAIARILPEALMPFM